MTVARTKVGVGTVQIVNRKVLSRLFQLASGDVHSNTIIQEILWFYEKFMARKLIFLVIINIYVQDWYCWNIGSSVLK